MWAIVIGLVHLLGVVSAGHAVMATRTAQGAIAWAVSLVAFPYLAVPLYWVFGRSKFEGEVEARNEHAEEIAGVFVQAKTGMVPYRRNPDEPVWRALEALSDRDVLTQNTVELLVDGTETFDSIVHGIVAAKQYVLVQFYIFRADGLGRRIGDALKQKAAEGLTCILLFDEIGSLGLPPAFVEELKSAGVQVSAFHTTRGARNRFQLNFRNHRKIVVVDGHTAWIGGHNVGDEYLGLDPKRGPWRDTHVKIRGPAAASAQGVVIGDWFWATRKLVELAWDPKPATDGEADVLVLPSGPTDRLETASLASVELVNAARKRLWIATPYFVPDQPVMAALRMAAMRGVDVRIILCKKADTLAVELASFWFLDALDGVGIRFFRYQRGFMHQKVVLVDNDLGVVGTVNWDSRSFRLNFEVNAVVSDATFNGRLEEMFVRDFNHCEEVDAGGLASRNFFFRLAVQVARLLAPIL